MSEIRTLGEKVPGIQTGASVKRHGQRQWIMFFEPELDEKDFPDILKYSLTRLV